MERSKKEFTKFDVFIKMLTMPDCNSVDLLTFLSDNPLEYNFQEFLKYIRLEFIKYPFINPNHEIWRMKVLGHVNLDKSFKKNKIVYGWLHNSAAEYMMDFLNSKDSQCFGLNQFKEKMQDWLTISRLLDWGIGQCPDQKCQIYSRAVNETIEKISKMEKPGDYYIFPAYWFQLDGELLNWGHAIACSIVMENIDSFSFLLYNTGMGSINHYLVQNQTKTKQSSTVKLNNLNIEQLVQIIQRIYNYSFKFDLLRSSSEMYIWLKTFGDYSHVRLPGDLITEQYSGTCVWSVLKAVLRDHVKTLLDYKVISFYIKLKSLVCCACYPVCEIENYDLWHQSLQGAYYTCSRAYYKNSLSFDKKIEDIFNRVSLGLSEYSNKYDETIVEHLAKVFQKIYEKMS